MDMPKGNDVQEVPAASGAGPAKYILRLYVTGITPRSLRAIDNIKAICDQHLQGRYELKSSISSSIRSLAEGEHLIAVPTLVKERRCRCEIHRRHDQ